MTVYVRTVRKPIKYRPWLRPWYRWLDWWQGANADYDVPTRFWTSRFGRTLCVVGPPVIRITLRTLVILLRVAGFLIFVVGFGTLFMLLSMVLGGGALGKASRATR
jgi:hypothetical protein